MKWKTNIDVELLCKMQMLSLRICHKMAKLVSRYCKFEILFVCKVFNFYHLLRQLKIHLSGWSQKVWHPDLLPLKFHQLEVWKFQFTNNKSSEIFKPTTEWHHRHERQKTSLYNKHLKKIKIFQKLFSWPTPKLSNNRNCLLRSDQRFFQYFLFSDYQISKDYFLQSILKCKMRFSLKSPFSASILCCWLLNTVVG